MSLEKEKKPIVQSELIRKGKAEAKSASETAPVSVSAGVIKCIVDYAFNPTRDKIREVTSIDRIQGHLLPQLDIVDMVWQYAIEVALFRQDANEYEQLFGKKRPVPPNLIDEFTYRTAQWQKSIQGANLRSAIDIALAETEARTGDETGLGAVDAWSKDD